MSSKKDVAKIVIKKPIISNVKTNTDPDIIPSQNYITQSSNKYQKLDLKEQILLRPDTYVGSLDIAYENEWVFNSDSGKMEQKNIKYCKGLFKIFDEIVVNAYDASVKDPTVKKISIDIIPETGEIVIMNDGKGLPIVVHETEKMYIPEMVFFHYLTSDNYDDSEERITGGRNGYGAKLANTFSTKFTLETVDPSLKLKFSQTAHDNLSVIEKPVIERYTRVPFTRVSFIPDYKRFDMVGIDQDTFTILCKRAHDLAACTASHVNVYLNNERLLVKTFDKFVDLFVGNKRETKRASETLHDSKRKYTWELEACLSTEGFKQISYVNGIATTEGGSHVDNVTKKIIDIMLPIIQQKHKGVTIERRYIREHLWIFLKTSIVNPKFSSQTKEKLVSKVSEFGFTVKISDKFVNDLIKCGFNEAIAQYAQFKDMRKLETTDRRNRSSIRNISKLEDATNAGTNKSSECTLILTEGDSAKTMAMSGLAVIGREKYGVFPLKGKPLNTREAPPAKLLKNEELLNIKKILGLQQNVVYGTGPGQTPVSHLRYGSVIIMTDQDVDGSHIRGLFINMIHSMWPSLLDIPGFIKTFVTPIVKVSKGKQMTEFFNLSDFLKWKEENDYGKNWKVKYYKGLGTSNKKEAREYFSKFSDHEVTYIKDSQEDDEAIVLAFDKNKADARKEWLSNYNKDLVLSAEEHEVSYKDFINKELIHFSVYDNERSIPSLCDGLKPSQRKIIWSLFKKKLFFEKDEVKVSQLGGYISEQTGYHHGEKSLEGAIIGMGQDYAGSNNINWLHPEGQFGSRIQNGKDAASGRYTETKFSKITPIIFNNSDNKLLSYRVNDDNKKVEPVYYLPIIPTILVNGCEGIGTGYSTHIPSYNPSDILENMRRFFKKEELIEMKPWYRGFLGTVEQVGTNTFEIIGSYERLNNTQVVINELPVGKNSKSFEEYKEFLNRKIIGYVPPAVKKEDGPVKKKTVLRQYLSDFSEQYTDVSAKFILTFADKQYLDELIFSNNFETEFKLSCKISTSNMVLFDEQLRLKKYSDPLEILVDFCNLREKLYVSRKEYITRKLTLEHSILLSKVRFLECIMDDTFSIYKKKKETVNTILEEHNFPKFGIVAINLDDDIQDDDKTSYKYLTSMAISSFTEEKLEEMKKKRDNVKADLDTINSKSAQNLWEDDLSDFEKTYEDQLDLWTKDFKDMLNGAVQPTTKVRKRRAPTKTVVKPPMTVASMISTPTPRVSSPTIKIVPPKTVSSPKLVIPKLVITDNRK